MTLRHRTLGTSLRHLIELLDGAVEQVYVDAQFDYRPRYTPVMRSLMAIGPASIKVLAGHGGLTHSATSQTIAQMARAGLVNVRRGEDQRQQLVSLTPKATAIIPDLKRIWQIVNDAADALEAEMAFPLSQVIESAVEALERQPFNDRIRTAAQHIDLQSEKLRPAIARLNV